MAGPQAIDLCPDGLGFPGNVTLDPIPHESSLPEPCIVRGEQHSDEPTPNL
jgi:hypothetical protein